MHISQLFFFLTVTTTSELYLILFFLAVQSPLGPSQVEDTNFHRLWHNEWLLFLASPTSRSLPTAITASGAQEVEFGGKLADDVKYVINLTQGCNHLPDKAVVYEGHSIRTWAMQKEQCSFLPVSISGTDEEVFLESKQKPIATDPDSSRLGDNIFPCWSGLPPAILVPYLNCPVFKRLDIEELRRGPAPFRDETAVAHGTYQLLTTLTR